jgi:hypothetical protein
LLRLLHNKMTETLRLSQEEELLQPPLLQELTLSWSQTCPTGTGKDLFTGCC